LGSAGKTEIKSSDHSEALARHLTSIVNWASQISFRDLRGSRILEESFVDLDLELGCLPTRRRSRPEGKRKVSDLLREHRNFMILGDPGAGKTTSLKRIAMGLIENPADRHSGDYPILVRLRDISSSSSLSGSILDILGITLKYDDGLDTEGRENLRLRVASQYLDNMRARLLLDGLDELHPGAKERVVRELRQLLLNSLNFSIIATCRAGDFTFTFDNADTLVLEPLSDDQIITFARKWLTGSAADEFLKQVRDTPYGGSEVLPLTLAHLCAIYERTGSVPEKPRTVYRKIVRLLLEEWDEQRSIQRPSAYASFETDRKEEFLRAIAFNLTLEARRGVFEHRHLEEAYVKVCESFGLPRNHVRQVVREIESHTGLIVEVAFEVYEFAHKAIQEYLAAEFILRLPAHPRELSFAMPNEMALAIAMSSDSTRYFFVVTESAISIRPPDLSSFTAPFLRRLLLEKADFTPDPDLGYATIALYYETFFLSEGQLRLPFEVESDGFTEFLKLQPIRSSIRSALRNAQITKHQDGTWDITWLEDKRKPRKQRCIIDRSFMEQANIDDSLPDTMI
jgi:hypothetical protein